MTEREEQQRQQIRKLVEAKVNQVVTYVNRENAIEAGFDPDECSESHFPGDCPLCGAR